MDSDQRMRGKRELQLQGPRPTPLKISKESHKIRKDGRVAAQGPVYRSQPVIIYTQSPKIIHIEAQNFMTLVQRLTGSTSSSDATEIHCIPNKTKDVAAAAASAAVSSSCSTEGSSRSCSDMNIHRSSGFGINEKQREQVTDHKLVCGVSEEGNADYENLKSSSQLTPPPFSPLSPNFLLPSPQLHSPGIFQDVPLFTPNFDSFFYSPAHFYRLSEPIFTLTPPSSVIAPSPTAKTHPQC